MSSMIVGLVAPGDQGPGHGQGRRRGHPFRRRPPPRRRVASPARPSGAPGGPVARARRRPVARRAALRSWRAMFTRMPAASHGDDQRRATEGDEGQRDAGHRQDADHRPHVDDVSAAIQATRPTASRPPKRSGARAAARSPNQAKRAEQDEHGQAPDQAQLLADHREDEVGVGVGQVAPLLPARRRARARTGGPSPARSGTGRPGSRSPTSGPRGRGTTAAGPAGRGRPGRPRGPGRPRRPGP